MTALPRDFWILESFSEFGDRNRKFYEVFTSYGELSAVLAQRYPKYFPTYHVREVLPEDEPQFTLGDAPKIDFKPLLEVASEEEIKAFMKQITLAARVADIGIDALRAENERLKAELEETDYGAQAVELAIQRDKALEVVKLYEEALKNILHEKNLAMQGHWDSTEKMGTIAYEALERGRKILSEGK